MAPTNNRTTNDNQISHYALEEVLAEQAASVIYLAKDTKTESPVFVVTLQPEAAKSSEITDRFQRRAETVAQLTHDILLPIDDFGLDGKRPFTVMPFRPGLFLSEKLAEADPTSSQSTDKAEVIASLELVKQLAEGLALAHPSGLFHHNLRPENIYLDETGKPYLLDLVVPPLPLLVSTQIEQAVPTELDYQSPEQLAGKALSGRSNIFSLGVLLYRLLAGHKPALPTSEWDIFDHKGITREVPLEQVRTDLTQETYTAVRDSIWQKEWSRFETVDAQIAALSRAINAESAPPPPPPPAWLQLLQTIRKSENLKFVIPAVVIIVLLIVALVFLSGRSNQQEADSPTDAPPTQPAETESNTDAAVDMPTSTSAPPTEDAANEVEVLPPAEDNANETPTAVATITATATEPPTATLAPAATNTTATSTATSTLEPTPTQCVTTPPFGWVRYAIQANDSLSAISQTTGTTVERLLAVNCLDSIMLSIGQEIWIPELPTPIPTATTAVTETATAVSGNSAPPPSTSIPPTPEPPPLP